MIFESLCGYTPTDILLHKDTILSEDIHRKIERITDRLSQQEPIQYILGYTDFCGRRFDIAPGALIPRPETEELTRLVITENSGQPSRIADLGTGSGCIAVTLALSLSDSKVEAWDISTEALEIAQRNARKHNAHVNFSQRDILRYDVSELPEESLDIIVSNPPYSIKWEGDDNPVLINDPRFSPAGVLAPKSKADLAFIMHSLAWLATNGTAAIVCFPGIMYRGGAEKKIRQYLIDNNFIDCIIQLPGNLFFGTSIATCIMVLKKSKAENKTLFIDASKEFVKVTNNNKLTEDNIAKIVASFVDREDKDYFCRLVPNDEIATQDYNLSVSTYVEQEDTREVINITELNAEIKRIVAREQVLRDEIDKIIAEIETN